LSEPKTWGEEGEVKTSGLVLSQDGWEGVECLTEEEEEDDEGRRMGRRKRRKRRKRGSRGGGGGGGARARGGDIRKLTLRDHQS